MRIDDLREVLHEQADTIEDPARFARVGEVHHRIGAARRRRRTGLAALAAAAVVVTAAGWAALAPDPVPDTGPARTDSVTYPDEYAGRTLLGSATSEPGDTAIGFDIPATPGRVFLTSTCTGPSGGGLELRVALGGRWIVRGPCDDAETGDPLGTGSTLDLGDPAYSGVVGAGGSVKVRLRVVRSGSDAPVADAPVELSAALYALPEPVGVLAGQPLDKQIYYDGSVWTLASWGQSDPGEPRRSATVTDRDRYVAVVAAGPDQQGVAQVLVNGREPGLRFGAGGSTTVDVGSGPTHEVEVRLRNGTDSSVLGIAFYRHAP